MRNAVRIQSLVIGTLLALAPPTSLVLLGWLMRQTRAAAFTRVGLSASSPNWVFGVPGNGIIRRTLGGLAANIQEGVLAAISLLLATLPFSMIWLLSWWAGWENSFGKGYEQAFVGPLLGLAGVLIFMLIMVYMPMALAHQAVESRALALFEIRHVKSAVRHASWGYLFLAATTVFLALPIFAGRGLIAFADGIVPGLADYSPAQISSLQLEISLVKGAYIVVALSLLRRWSGRLYAVSVLRARAGRDAKLWADSALAGAADLPHLRSFALTRIMRFGLLMVIWFGLAAQIYFAQFLNHDWHVWVTHPFIFLPWII